jgi:hypothetical protein
VDGCLNGTQTSDNFQYAGPLSETVQLGNVATRFCTDGPIDSRTGSPLEPKVLEWDAANLRFPNFPEADKLLTKTYREGWAI